MEPIIKVQCLKHTYPDKTEVNFCGNDFFVYPGERVAILGANGSGKTTLLLHVLGLLAPLEGFVQVMGHDPVKDFSFIRKNLGVLLQNTDEQIIGPRVFDDIAFTLSNQKVEKSIIETKVRDIADVLGIGDILNKVPHYLSGGQKKKVALAGALITLPRILILDEPFDSLDPRSKADIIRLMNRMNKEHGITIVTTTHDVNIAYEIADRIFVIDKGKTLISGTPEEVFSKAELLLDASLEPPILSALFQRLKNRNKNMGIPYTLDAAEKEILDKMVFKDAGSNG
ncbi:MAG: ATP-binding cassette domain-containing protein [Clostridia bacterium]